MVTYNKSAVDGGIFLAVTDKIWNNESLTPEQQQELHQLMEKYQGLCCDVNKDLPASVLDRHLIKTGDHRPIRKEPYKLPKKYEKFVLKKIVCMLEKGIIERSKSQWASSVIIMPKKMANYDYV